MAFVAGTYNFSVGGAAGTYTLTVTYSPTAGNTLVIFPEASATVATAPVVGWITSVTDNIGTNTYVNPTGGFGSGTKSGAGYGFWMYYCQTVGSGVISIIIHFTTTLATNQLIATVVEYSGLGAFNIAGAINVQNTAATTANSITSTAGITTVNGATIIGMTQSVEQTINMTVGTVPAFTSRYHVADFTMTEDYIQPTAGSIAATFTPGSTVSEHWGTGMLAFAPPATDILYPQTCMWVPGDKIARPKRRFPSCALLRPPIARRRVIRPPGLIGGVQ